MTDTVGRRMFECRFSSCNHAPAIAAIGWKYFIPVCKDHCTPMILRSVTFRWL